MASNKTRVEKWNLAISKLYDGLEALRELRDDYQQWRDNLPDSLESSAVADKLDALLDLPYDELESAVSDMEGADLPLGFGRD